MLAGASRYSQHLANIKDVPLAQSKSLQFTSKKQFGLSSIAKLQRH
jgi:hypothetical protein